MTGLQVSRNVNEKPDMMEQAVQDGIARSREQQEARERAAEVFRRAAPSVQLRVLKASGNPGATYMPHQGAREIARRAKRAAK